MEVPNPGACEPEAFTLSRLDAATGKLAKVSDRRGTWMIAGGFAWMATLEGGADLPNQLLRLALSTGSVETWDREPVPPHEPGSYCWTMSVVGIDGDGAPLVMLPGRNETVLLSVTRPGQAVPIFSGPLRESIYTQSLRARERSATFRDCRSGPPYSSPS